MPAMALTGSSPRRLGALRRCGVRVRASAAASEARTVRVGRVDVPPLSPAIQGVVDACLDYDMALYTPIEVPGFGKIGCCCDGVVEALQRHPDVFSIDTGTCLITMREEFDTFDKRTEAMAAVSEDLHRRGYTGKWRDEPFPATMAYDAEPAFAVERAVVPLLGLRGYGVHANGLVRDPAAPGGFRLWVGRRAADKATWPGKLDHVAAGGQPLGLDPRANMVKECGEEAGIGPELAEAGLVSAGAVSYRLGQTDQRMIEGTSGVASSEPVHSLKRDVLFVYDLELPADFVPVPVDGEVESFALMDLQSVVDTIAHTDDFKPNVALVIVDLLVRRGVITPEQPGFLKLVRSLRLLDCQ